MDTGLVGKRFLAPAFAEAQAAQVVPEAVTNVHAGVQARPSTIGLQTMSDIIVDCDGPASMVVSLIDDRAARMTFRFNQLLDDAGIAPAAVRLLRHNPKVAGRSLVDVWRGDRVSFDRYQSLQPVARRSYFAGAYWASFIATWDGRTMFAGLYRVGAPVVVTEAAVDPLSGTLDVAGTFERYPLDGLAALRPYQGCIHIDWGGGATGKRAWVQRADLQDKLVTELYRDAKDAPFPGLMALAGPLSQLADAPPSWVQRLAEAHGVYLLTCPRDGSLYIGSATGAGGFWERWSAYRANGHGGNVALIGRDPSDFIVSILQVAGSTDNADAILAVEDQWKAKLLTIDFGLNRNGADACSEPASRSPARCCKPAW